MFRQAAAVVAGQQLTETEMSEYYLKFSREINTC